MITNSELQQRILAGEDSYTEFKEKFSDADSIAAELCVFLNFQGGWLIFGVKDDGEISGLSSEQAGDIATRIGQIMKDNIRPPIDLALQNIMLEDKRLCVVIVPEDSGSRPYSCKGRYWVRSGATRRELSSEQLRRLSERNPGLSTDERPFALLSETHLDLIDIKAYINKRYPHLPYASTEDIYQFLQKVHLASPSHINLAGFLLFNSSPAIRRADLTIKMISYQHNERDTDFLDQAQGEGNLLAQFRQAMNFARRNLAQIKGEGGFNRPNDQIHHEALEEIIMNALIHREYGINSPVQLFIYPNRLELISPGNLPNHLDEITAANGVSIARNPVLASHAYHLLPYRGTGTGLLVLKKHHPLAVLKNDQQQQTFTVTIPR